MKHAPTLGAALASLLLATSTYAFDPLLSPAADEQESAAQWVRQRLASGFDGLDIKLAALPGTAAQPGTLSDTFPAIAAQSTENRAGSLTSAQSPQQTDLNARQATPKAAGSASVEEVVVVGIRQHAPEWHPPTMEEPEHDWHQRDKALRTDTGRIQVGRAVVYQDLSDRRQYAPFRDEYIDPQPHQSVVFGLGARTDRD